MLTLSTIQVGWILGPYFVWEIWSWTKQNWERIHNKSSTVILYIGFDESHFMARSIHFFAVDASIFQKTTTAGVKHWGIIPHIPPICHCYWLFPPSWTGWGCLLQRTSCSVERSRKWLTRITKVNTGDVGQTIVLLVQQLIWTSKQQRTIKIRLQVHMTQAGRENTARVGFTMWLAGLWTRLFFTS